MGGLTEEWEEMEGWRDGGTEGGREGGRRREKDGEGGIEGWRDGGMEGRG
jgi:hypothetical protein